MREYKLNFHAFISSIALFSIIIAGIVLMASGKCDWKDLANLILNYSFVTIPLSLIWLYFQKIGWRNKCWKWLGPILHFPPDIRGRWVGNLYRINDPRPPHPFVMEIKQTMTEIKVCTYSERGYSDSIVDNICCDKFNNFTLCFLWQGEAGPLQDQTDESGLFEGYTILKFSVNSDIKRLKGRYFTNRQPKQTIGKLDLYWERIELKNEF